MTPEARTFYPLYVPASPCEVLECSFRVHRIGVCREEGCGYRWAREAAEDRGRREERDRRSLLPTETANG